MKPHRVIAVDWSGARRGAAKKIWLCEVVCGRVRRLESGRGRGAVGRELVAAARRDPRLVAGLDFAFSLPLPFLRKRGHRAIDDVWREVELAAEGWLADCPFPFWGKPGRKKPRLSDRVFFRRTDLEAGAAGGRRPLSVFQIGGAGAVGVGSLRGMPILRRLRRQGYAVWPFDPPRLPLAIEIWPRAFMGSVTKSDPRARRAFLAERYPRLEAQHREAAGASDDAFDALVSALEMDRRRDELAALETVSDPGDLLEGRIWTGGGDARSR